MSRSHRSRRRTPQSMLLVLSIAACEAMGMPMAEAVGMGGGGTSAPSSQITTGTMVVPVTGSCGGGYSQGQVATPQNIDTLAQQVSHDSTWLGTIVAQGSQQVTNQLRMNMQAQANLMTAQDRQLVAAVKQKMGTGYQNAYNACMTATKSMCTNGVTNGSAAAAPANAAAPAMVSSLLNGGKSLTAPNVTCTSKNCYGYNAGRTFTSTVAAIQSITQSPPQEFAAEDSLLPSVKASGVAGLKQMSHFVAHLTNPRPTPALPSNQENSAAGKEYQAMQREENAELSLAQSALVSVGAENLPTIEVASLQPGSSNTTSGSGMNAQQESSLYHQAQQIAANNGTPDHISSDQYLKVFSGSFFFNPQWDPTTVATNQTKYHQQMLVFAAANLQINDRIMRAMEYTEANVAAIQSLKTRQLFEARLAALRQQAMSGQANN